MRNLDIDLKRSKQFILFLMLLFLSSEMILLLSPVLLMVKLLLAFIVFLYCLDILFLHGLQRYKNSIIGLCLSKNGWVIEDRSGFHSAELCGSSTITRYLCILRFKVKNKTRSCIIFNDAIEEKYYRRLLLKVRG